VIGSHGTAPLAWVGDEGGLKKCIFLVRRIQGILISFRTTKSLDVTILAG
jgi:hypothetical protein